MAKKDWVFNLDNVQHSLRFEQGISGKKKILIDGNLAYESTGIMDSRLEFPFEVEGHSIVLVIKPGLKDKFDLFVDDRSLETGKLGPDRVVVEDGPEGLTLTFKGSQPAFAIVLLVAMFFVSIPVVMIINSFSPGGLTLADMMFIPVFFLLAGLGLLYWSLVKMLNKTILTVNSLEISVRNTPIPWFGQRVLQVADVENIHCESYERRSQSGEGMITVTMSFLLYRLCAKLTNGRRVVLLADLDKCYEALFINRQMGTRLGKLVQPGIQPA